MTTIGDDDHDREYIEHTVDRHVLNTPSVILRTALTSDRFQPQCCKDLDDFRQACTESHIYALHSLSRKEEDLLATIEQAVKREQRRCVRACGRVCARGCERRIAFSTKSFTYERGHMAIVLSSVWWHACMLLCSANSHQNLGEEESRDLYDAVANMTNPGDDRW